MREDKEKSIWWTLRLTFGLVPIIAGLDKFTNILTYWPHYLSPLALKVVPVSAETFMRGVGIIEIIAGILVLTVTRFGAYLVSAWLAAIAINLLTLGNYYDVAVRDLVMAISALSLARLTEARTEGIGATTTTRRRERFGEPAGAAT
jgi:uncharacterized membrane protein YphA (DoxX/SURF4 family)